MMKNRIKRNAEISRNSGKGRRRRVSLLLAGALLVSCSMFWQLRTDGTAMAGEADPVLTPDTSEGEEDAGRVTTLAAGGNADFTVTYNWTGGGYGGLGFSPEKLNGEPVSGRAAATSFEVEMPYTVDLNDFVISNLELATDEEYRLLYATVTDPNYGDEEHASEFDAPPEGETGIGQKELYGDEDNPVTGITISFSEADATKGEISKTWHYALNYRDGSTETLSVYGNKNGGYDDGGKYCPRYLTVNLYFTSDPYVVTWKAGARQSFVGYETRDIDTGELLGGSSDWSKTGVDTAIAMTDNGLLSHVGITDYNYYYAVVRDPEGGEYGTEQKPVTAIWAEVQNDASTGGSIWSYSIRSGDEVLGTVTKSYAAEDSFDPGRDLLITLYYIDNGGEKCVALDSRSGGAGYGGRDYIKGLEKYADADGNIEITLPDNGSLGKNFVVFTDKATGKKVTLNASKVAGSNGFEWEVVGWFNIATGEYVDVSEGPGTTVVNLKNHTNVFYADLVAASYDNGSEDDDGYIPSDMTGDFVTVKLYDYNELFNLYSSALTQSGFESESWDAGYESPIGAKLYDAPVLSDIEEMYYADRYLTKSFLFTFDAWGAGNLICPKNLNWWNEWTGKDSTAVDDNFVPIRYQVASASNWGISSPDKSSEGSSILKMLFDESGNTYGVHYIGEADGLFRYGGEEDQLEIIDQNNPLNNQYYDFNGYYYYTSAINGAAYNRSESRFYLYDNTEKYGTYTMFLPFNPHKSAYDSREIDYWFGMEMTVDFYLPGDTGQHAEDEYGNRLPDRYANTVNGEEMQFFFTGDDDIMVFVDDMLVLDMAGIHDEAVGWINFATGEYYYHCLDQVNHTAGGRDEGSFNNPDVAPLDLSAGTHTLTVYYLERGGGASNLTVSFNIMPSWRYYTDETTTVTAEKVWSDGNENHEGESVTVGLFEEVLDTDGFERSENGEGDIIYSRTAEGTTESYIFAGGTGYAYDDEGNIVALLDYKTDEETETPDDPGGGQAGTEEKTLYVLVGETLLGDPGRQELGPDNDWMFAWELLDNSRTYRVIELEIPYGYTTSSTFSAFDKWKYWSIIGKTEMEEMYKKHSEESDGESEEFWVILTDAAASWNEDEGLPVKGNVVKNTISSGVDRVIFSEPPKWFELSDGNVSAEFGEIPDSQIYGLSVKWKVEFTESTATGDEHSKNVHTFYLVYVPDDPGAAPEYVYVNTVNGTKTLRKRILANGDPDAFYVDYLGELRVDGTDERVIYVEDAAEGLHLQVVHDSEIAEYGEDNHNIRIYTLSEIDTYGTAFTIVNSQGLPNTGGPGTKPFAAAGTVLTGLAGGLLLLRKRKGGGAV